MAVLLILSFVPAVKAEPSRLGRTPIGREDHVFVEMPGFIRPAEPTIQGTIGILVELNSGTILYAKNMHQQNYPASTTKVMTALLALENLQLNDTLTLSYNSTHDLISGGFDGRFREGQTFRGGGFVRTVPGFRQYAGLCAGGKNGRQRGRICQTYE